MLKRLAGTVAFVLAASSIFAQGGWIARPPMPWLGRGYAMANSLGNKMYVCGGEEYTTLSTRQQWEFDLTTQTWTEKAWMPIASIGSTQRMAGFACSANGKMYYGLGVCDFWQSTVGKYVYEYDPATDAWAFKGDFPGPGRWMFPAVTVNNKIYVTTGVGTGTGYLNDMWEYEPLTNTWTQKASLPGPARGAASGFAINGMIYVVGGYNAFGGFMETWQYNTATDTWTQKAYPPIGATLQGGTGFSANGYGYILRQHNPGFWQYNPVTDTWTQQTDFPAAARHVASSFNIGTRAFVAFGESSTQGNHNDLWEFNPACLANITNIVTASSPSGTSCAPIVVDTLRADTILHGSVVYQWLKSTDSVNYTPVAGGNGVRLLSQTVGQTTFFKRAVTMNALCTDTSLPFKVSVMPVIAPSLVASATGICQGDTALLSCLSPLSKRWYRNGLLLPDTGQTLKTAVAGSYRVALTNGAGCSDTTMTVTVQVFPLPAVGIIQSGGTLASTTAVSYQWYIGLTPIPGATQQTYVPGASGLYSVKVTDANGCSTQSAAFPFTYMPASIAAEALRRSITIFPNPAKDVLTIRNDRGENLRGVLRNLLSARTTAFTILPGEQRLNLTGLGLAPGVYILSVVGEEGVAQQKVVIE